jgi:hypothetical protein
MNFTPLDSSRQRASFQIKIFEVRSGQVRSGQVRSGQVRSGHDLKREVANLRRTEEEWKTRHKPETKEVGVQTEVKHGPPYCHAETAEVSTQTGQVTKNQVSNAKTYEEYASIASEKWEDSCFTATEIVEGNPLQATRDTDLSLWVTKDDEMENGLQKMYKERFPELSDLKGEKVAYIKISTTYGNTTQNTSSDRYITRMEAEKEEREYHENLKQLCFIMIREGRAKVAIPKPDMGGLTRFRRMAECVFGRHGLKVIIYVSRKRKGNETDKQEQEKEKPPERPPRRRNNALIVSDESCGYSQLLKKIKDRVIEEGNQKAVRTMRKTREGSLLIEIEKGEGNVASIEKIVEIEAAGAKTRKLDPSGTTTLHIRGMDELTTAEDLEKALRNLTDLKGTHLTVGKLRPAYGGTQVATLRVSKEMARKMLQTKNVKVGLNSCSIRERVDIRMCYKCWGYDHHASECREEDKKNQCRKCGEEGHHSGECKNDAYCIKCNRAGHAAGSTQCKAFKDALKKRQMEAKKTDDRKTQGGTHDRDRRTSNVEGANDPFPKNEEVAGISGARQE